MPIQRSSPFLTLEDPNAKIKGSRDPLGVQPIWAAFGRHVVTNLTTQSSSVRGFTTLLLGRYFAAELVDRGMATREDALDIFLRMEQLSAYVRYVAHGALGEEWRVCGRWSVSPHRASQPVSPPNPSNVCLGVWNHA